MEPKKDPIEISEIKAASEQAEDKATPAISGRKLAANQENAKKSTGPRTPEGKANSRFNAVRHGVLARQIMFSPDGKLLDERLYELLEALRDKYGRHDARTELLIEGIVTDHWRSRIGLQYELELLKNAIGHFSSLGSMSNLMRYNTASRRAILKNLALLDELQPTPLKTQDRDYELAEPDALSDPEVEPGAQVEGPPTYPQATDAVGNTPENEPLQPPPKKQSK